MDCRGSRKLETLSHTPLSATHAGSQQWEKGTAVGGNRSGDSKEWIFLQHCIRKQNKSD